MRFNQDPLGQLNWIVVVNYSDETVPAYAVCQPSGADGEGCVRVVRPDKDGQTAVLFNGPLPIAPGRYGQATAGVPARALYDPRLGSDPLFDEVWGVWAGSWRLSPGPDGFKVMGGLDTSGGSVVVTLMDRSLEIVIEVISLDKVRSFYPAREHVLDTLAQVTVGGRDCWFWELREL